MRRRTAPFGNDLQDDFDVKLINGRIVQISNIQNSTEKKPLKEDQETNKSTQEPTLKSGYHDILPREKHKLPPIKSAGKTHGKFHSAPPKLLSSKWASKQPDHELESSPTKPNISDSVAMFNSQLLGMQRKRPHALEDIDCSCKRLDAFRSGTITLQELTDILYINGISINTDTLREFCDHSNLDISNGNQVSYRDVIKMLALNSGSSDGSNSVTNKQRATGPQNSRTVFEVEKRNRNQKLFSHHRKRLTDLLENDNLSGDNNHVLSRMIVSCPERVTMATPLDAIDDDEVLLLDDLQDCFSGTRWGNHGDMQRLESRLAMADKQHDGLLPATVIARVFHEQSIPLRGALLDDVFQHCEEQGMIRWTELVELIKKSLPIHYSVNNTRQQLAHHDDYLRGTPYSTVTTMKDGSLRQQAKDLYKRMSQQHDAVYGPLQRLCDALYTCDPHKTGYVDMRTAIRLVRNYNIVYRMGLNVAAIESFITSNSRGSKHNITISLIVDQLSQELDTSP